MSMGTEDDQFEVEIDGYSSDSSSYAGNEISIYISFAIVFSQNKRQNCILKSRMIDFLDSKDAEGKKRKSSKTIPPKLDEEALLEIFRNDFAKFPSTCLIIRLSREVHPLALKWLVEKFTMDKTEGGAGLMVKREPFDIDEHSHHHGREVRTITKNRVSFTKKNGNSLKTIFLLTCFSLANSTTHNSIARSIFGGSRIPGNKKSRLQRTSETI